MSSESSDAHRIRRAFELCFGRQPDAEELKMGLTFLERASVSAGADAEERGKVLTSFCQAMLAAAEFRNLD